MSDDRESGGLRPWQVILGVCVLLIVAIILWVFIEKNNVESRLQALRDQGQPTSYAEWAEKYRVPPGIENAAELYRMAAGAFVKPIDDVNTPFTRSQKAKQPPKGTPLPEEMIQTAEQFLTDNEQVLALLRKAKSIEHSYYERGSSQDMPPLAEIRDCVRLLAAAAVLEANRGNTAGSMAYLDDAMHTAQSLHNQPELVSYLVRLACFGLCVDVMQHTLSLTTFTNEQLVELEHMLSEAGSSLDLARAFSGERCGSIELINNPSLLEGGGGPLMVPGIKSVGLGDVLDYMGSCIEACELPPVERIARLKELGEELEQLSALHVVVKILAPALSRIAEIDLLCRTELDMARTAVAIERYRLAKGERPKDLGELIPDYLDQVPVDPYDEQPIRYRPDEIGYVLYSLGPDAQDNEGLSKEEANRDAPYDWPFVVTR